MAIDLQPEINIDYIEHELLQDQDIRLGILRLDQIHPLVSGNKWFKLKRNISHAQQEGYDTLLTFGGACSNHLIATADAAKVFGLRSVGIVRGLHGKDNPTQTLRQCEEMGMQLHYVCRGDYDKKEEKDYQENLLSLYPGAFIIPEGGDNINGVSGAGEIAAYIPGDITDVALAVGTGTTFSGILNELNGSISMLGFPVMKGGVYLKEKIEERLSVNRNNWMLYPEYHFGGFAKHNPVLIRFMNDFYKKHHVPLDFVYTAKMIYGIFDLIHNGYFTKKNNILCIHTGGLQGNNTVNHLLEYF